jgi:hypothetical protein
LSINSQKDIRFNPTARTYFSEFLPFDGKESDTSHKLQQKLERHFGDLITIQPQEEGSLTSEFNIETSSGVGYSSSEMVMSLICLLKMQAAACKI